MSNDFDDRERHWSSMALQQFGNANNFFTVTAIALLGFLTKSYFEVGQIELNLKNPSFNLTALGLSIMSCFLSALLGSSVLISRLYDLRLTRHKLLIRRKVPDDKTKYLNNSYIDTKENIKLLKYLWNLISNFFSTILTSSYFFRDSDYKEAKVLGHRFTALRLRILLLGQFSWLSFRWQLFWLMTSLFCYTIYIL